VTTSIEIKGPGIEPNTECIIAAPATPPERRTSAARFLMGATAASIWVSRPASFVSFDAWVKEKGILAEGIASRPGYGVVTTEDNMGLIEELIALSGVSAAPFICECRDAHRSACAGLPFFRECKNLRYCVLHYPAQEKVPEFKKALDRKLASRDFNFRGVWFPQELDGPFKERTFPEKADFLGATFREWVSFRHSHFEGNADFSDVTFCKGARFAHSTFDALADFKRARFAGRMNFRFAFFRSAAIFEKENAGQGFCPNAWLDLRNARIEKPEQISFRNVHLSCAWFKQVDSRKFDFTAVTWDELQRKDQRIFRSPHPEDQEAHAQKSRTYRALAINAEENSHYDDASRLRFLAMNERRLTYKSHAFAPWKLHWWYWLASGYGEQVGKAFVVLIGILVLFGFYYTYVGFRSQTNCYDVSELAHLPNALAYSLRVMSLEKPEPKPVNPWAQVLVGVETILGPAQAALLLLAIRRKFMR
jgi:hypothetical protein